MKKIRNRRTEDPSGSRSSDRRLSRESANGLVCPFPSGLKKTSDLLNTDIRDLFKREGRLVDDEFLDELFAILVKTDMGAGPANEIRDRVQSDNRGRVVQMEEVLTSDTGILARTDGAGSGADHAGRRAAPP